MDFHPRPVLSVRGERPRPQPVEVTLVDDRGTRAVGSFGSASFEPASGHMGVRSALSIDTAWIEFDGHCCQLVDDRPPVTVRIEPARERDPAMLHLWRQVAIRSHFGGPPIDLRSAIEALLAAGTLSAEDAATVQAVHETLTAVDRGDPLPDGHDRFPEPWRSVFDRYGHDDGPAVTILASTTVPPIDGISLALRRIESAPAEFVIAVECTPSLGLITRYDWDSAERLAWWATDDRANHYLGHPRAWVSHDHAGNGDDSHAQITFRPALDPAAQRLEIIPTAETTQAVLTIPLERRPRQTADIGT